MVVYGVFVVIMMALCRCGMIKYVMGMFLYQVNHKGVSQRFTTSIKAIKAPVLLLKSIGQNILVAHFGINDVFNGAIAGGCIPSFVYLCSQLLLCSVSEELVQVERVMNYFGCVLEMAGSQKVSYVFFLFLIEVDVHVILSVSVKLLYKGGYWEV